MAKVELTLESLSKIDGGRLNVAFQQELHRVLQDCIDRPALDTPRTITLKVSTVPTLNDDGTLGNAVHKVTINGNLPKRESKPYHSHAGNRGFFVDDLSLDDADQRTFDFHEPTEVRSKDQPEPEKESETA